MEQKQLIRSRIVDTREPWDIREKLIETGWEQSYLKSGDFYFQTHNYKRAGVTRKTTDDFMGSLNDKFSQQLEEMLDFYDIKILLIENPWRWITSTSQMIGTRGVERHVKKEVLNYIHRYQAKGFIVERTSNLRDSVNRLNELYALYQRPYSMSAKSKGYVDDRLLAMPSGCRGKTGQAILEDRSLKEVVSMSVEQYLNIDGVGKKRAESLYNHFNRRSNNNE